MPLRDLLRWQPPFDEATPDEVATELLDAHGAPVPVSATSAPLRDQADNPIGVVVVLRDMREIEDLRRAMLTQARLAAVGELAAGLAHEINNPLAFVRANLSQLKGHWEEVCSGSVDGDELQAIAQDGREMLDESLVGTDRAAEIVRGVRRFTHAGFASRELADLNALVEDTLAMLRAQARSAVIEFEPGAIPSVPCEPQQMRGVFLNLINNAVQAVDENGRVRVVTQSEGDDVVVEVSDSGCGIEAATLDRIFDPFFTTKQVGEGTGLGLAIAWHVVAAHGGRIEVRSAPGNGSCFRVRLPVKDLEEVAPAAG
jgi:two-component system NtrC family sensor kinase